VSIVEIEAPNVRRAGRRVGETAFTDPVFADDGELWQWTGDCGGGDGVITDVHTPPS
jgi:hypothetical protein